MEILKIATFNIKNNFKNRRDYKKRSQIIKDLIVTEQFDLLGTQELTFKYVNELNVLLNEYKAYGNFRYNLNNNSIITKLPYNETNSIITNREVLEDYTVRLPWIPTSIKEFKPAISNFSLIPRIATINISKSNRLESKPICMINTHLEYGVTSIQVQQLESLKQLIIKSMRYYPTIIAGDFNMEPTNQNFLRFTQELGKMNINRIDINDKTWKDKTLDHIFVSNDIDVLDYKVETNKQIQNISDHNLLIAKIKIK